MRKLLPFLLAGTLAFGGTTIVDDVFAAGDSSTQDLLNNLLQVFNGRTNNIRTDAPGSLTIDMTPAGGSSEAIWAFFTKSGAPINLGVGDRLSVRSQPPAFSPTVRTYDSAFSTRRARATPPISPAE